MIPTSSENELLPLPLLSQPSIPKTTAPTATTSTTTTTTTTTHPSSPPQRSVFVPLLASPVKKADPSSQSPLIGQHHHNSWIFNLNHSTYKSCDNGIGSQVKLKSKQNNVLLKQGDQFYFSIIKDKDKDKDKDKAGTDGNGTIVALATVCQEPKIKKSDSTYEFIMRFDRFFQEPIPRDHLGTVPQLANLSSSKSTFTNISEQQLPLFVDLINNYSSQKVKKEAINFLTGITLAPTNSPVKSENQGGGGSVNVSPLLSNSMIKLSNRSLESVLLTSSSSSSGQLQSHLLLPPLGHSSSSLSTSTSQSHLRIPVTPKKSTIAEYNSNYNISINQRIFFTTGSGHPMAVFSMIRGDSRNPNKSKGKSTSKESHDKPVHSIEHITHIGTQLKESSFFSRRSSSSETSYAHLLTSVYVTPYVVVSPDEVDSSGIPLKYDPLFLDNSELKTGKHRTVMNLQSYTVSIFPHIKKAAIKEELNEQFQQKHPWIRSGITLYKIRKLKRKLKKLAILTDLELSTLALSFVAIEKLIIKSFITKLNIKLYAAVCLLLASKFNDPKATITLKPLIDSIEKKLSITRKELLSAEFQIYSHLSFGMFVDCGDVLPHYNRIVNELRASPPHVHLLNSQYSM
ncbi:hypothetical protein SAMD00019534_102560 [Acytostelium subglobosum LB1]|uniref:hypothetical protein n=1 Tax=Acytostelium subglobosum LB1 TaxID=1410327 RepID=UPI000644DDF8|nr:hypothetical protein SAMD00019534_102560 [Acytostelium subglobosum LB1]GAM27081.1 hypothetical protein SAMD00019534_102560 [Acytostelium subglobosum LB1]|eukprot:XP_012749961.1 hypothetical protein SAMD00019534_102560 [Acytostelium subglobosum LB1]